MDWLMLFKIYHPPKMLPPSQRILFCIRNLGERVENLMLFYINVTLFNSGEKKLQRRRSARKWVEDEEGAESLMSLE